MQYFLFGIVALAVALLVIERTPSSRVAVPLRALSIVGGIAALGIGIAGLLRGWSAAGLVLVGIGVYLLLRQMRPGWSAFGHADAPRTRTEHLDIEIDLETGAIRGRVLKGFFAGRSLKSLRAVELAHLWADCQFADPPSARILADHLDRLHPTWRDDMARTSGPEAQVETPDGKLRMSREEALDILGLAPGATADDVRRAHRVLMLKLHPDRGGSHILAAKVNEAKDVLLE